jgi:uncharacterized protein (TIGR03435 family)
MRAAVVAVLLVQSPAAGGQGTPAGPGAAVAIPAFEVASVRRNTGTDTRYVMRWSPDGRFRATNITAKRLIDLAYDLRTPHQLTGVSGWIASERFDIDASPAVTVPRPQQRLMLQRLLRDRFGLVMRAQPVDVPVYALVRTNPDAPLPRAIRESTVDCIVPRIDPDVLIERVSRGEPIAGDPRCPGVRVLERGHIVSTAGRINTLIADISPFVDRRIRDWTGLSGRYDFELTWSPDESAGADLIMANAGIFAAIQELGLKLQPTSSREQGYVIERIQRPTPN